MEWDGISSLRRSFCEGQAEVTERKQKDVQQAVGMVDDVADSRRGTPTVLARLEMTHHRVISPRSR